MAKTEAEKEASHRRRLEKEYERRKRSYTRLSLSFKIRGDDDIIDYLNASPNKAKTVKDAIRDKMKKEGWF